MQKIGFIILNAFLWLFFITSSAILFVGAAILKLITAPFDKNLKILHQYSCFWASLYIWANPFWSLRHRGVQPDKRKTYVIVANHQSMTDILSLFNTFLHFKWVSKKEMFKVPLIGWNMTLNRHVAIDRGNPNSRVECMNQCREWLEKGSSVVFFPEGTRSKDGNLLPFKIGAFRLALEAGFDVLPIVIQGSLNALPKHSLLLTRKSQISVTVLSPVSIQPFLHQDLDSGAQALSDLVRSKIQEKI